MGEAGKQPPIRQTSETIDEARLRDTALVLADIRHGPIGGTSVAPTAMADTARGRLERLPEHERRCRPGTEVFGGERFRATEYVC